MKKLRGKCFWLTSLSLLIMFTIVGYWLSDVTAREAVEAEQEETEDQESDDPPQMSAGVSAALGQMMTIGNQSSGTDISIPELLPDSPSPNAGVTRALQEYLKNLPKTEPVVTPTIDLLNTEESGTEIVIEAEPETEEVEIAPITKSEKTEAKLELVKNEASTEAKPACSDVVWTGWAYYESGESCWNNVNSDGGNAFGRFQLDARHSLAGFFKYASERDEDFVGLERYYRKNGNRLKSQRISELAPDWQWLFAVYDVRFSRLQLEYASGMFYFPMRDELLEKRGIDLDKYGPVLKGTVWSVAVRNGNFLPSIHTVTDTYYDGIDEEEWLCAIYAAEARRHPGQENRWKKGQLQAALETLHQYEDGKTTVHDDLDSEAWKDLQRIEEITIDKEGWKLAQSIKGML